jgi:hypothetical protein
MNYWEIIADILSKAGWSLGWVSALNREGRTIWIVDAHRGNGKRFLARADEKLRGFLELESASRESPSFPHSIHCPLQPLRNTGQARDGTTKV